jgi:hypothetical protein
LNGAFLRQRRTARTLGCASWNNDEIYFRKLSGPNVNVLAVCPKKGLYFIEVFAEPKDISKFKKNILESDLKVVDISVYQEKTKIGSQVLMVEFEY